MNDLISRQAAIDALKEHRALYCDNTPDTFSKLSYAEKSRVDELDTAIATLVNLPSAEPKTGKWIYCEDETTGFTDGYRCDQCGVFVPWDYVRYEKPNYILNYDFCPACGARMKGEENG